MPESPKEKPAKAESFVGNVMKYSIATYLGFLISGAALIIKGVLPADTYAVPATFMAYTMSLMNLGMLGLDQALLRFYREPPEGTAGRGMFFGLRAAVASGHAGGGRRSQRLFCPPPWRWPSAWGRAAPRWCRFSSSTPPSTCWCGM